MALTLRAASGANLVAATPVSQTITLPTGTTTNDLTYFCIGIANVVSAPVLSGGTGWTLLLTTDATGTSSTIIGYKTIVASEVAPTVSWTTAARVSWVAITLAPAAGAIAQHSGYATVLTGASATTHTPNSYAAGALSGASVLLAGPRVTTSLNAIALTNTPPTNYTEPTNGDQSTASGNFRQISAWTGYRLAQTGTIAPGVITHSAASNAPVHHAFAVEVVPAPKISTISTDFSSMPAFFNGNWQSPTIVSGQGVVTTTTAYPAFQANGPYDVTSDSCYMQVVSAAGGTGGTKETFIEYRIDSNNFVRIGCSGGNMAIIRKVAGVQTPTTLAAYNATDHAWWRVRESGGTIFLDGAPDGSTWTNLGSASSGLTLTSVIFSLVSGYYGTETSPPNSVFDNLNIAGPAIDASTPARVNGATTNGTVAVTTAAFNPPVSVLVAAFACNARTAGGGNGTVSDIVMTNNGAALTWTTANIRHLGDSGGLSGCAAILTAPLTAGRTGMTVTATVTPGGVANDINTPSLKLYVVTGADPTNPLGASAEGSSTTNAITTTAFTTQAATSLGIWSGCEWNATGAITSSDTTVDTFPNTGLSVSTGSGYKPLGAAGSSATFNLDAFGTGAAAWNWVSAEIKATGSATAAGLPQPVVNINQVALNRAAYF